MKFTLLVSFLLLGSAFSVCGQDAANKNDREKLQGKWTAVALYENGKNVLPKAGLTVLFQGDKAIYQETGQKEVLALFQVDANKKPKLLDLTLAPDPKIKEDKGLKILAIYQLEGDTLKICYRLPLPKDKVQNVTERPTEFDSKNFGTLFELKRAK